MQCFIKLTSFIHERKKRQRNVKGKGQAQARSWRGWGDGGYWQLNGGTQDPPNEDLVSK